MTKYAIGAILFFSSVSLGQEGNDLLAKYERELQSNPRSSITQFRVGEIYFQQGKFVPAANAFPTSVKWGFATEVGRGMVIGKPR